MGVKDNIKRLIISFILISTFAIVEVIGGIITGSLALISDAGHMVTDALSILIALFAQIIASRRFTRNMTYGLYRAEAVAAFFNGIFLIGLLAYIVYEAFERFQNPREIMGLPMLIIAFTGLVINIIAMIILSKASHENINIKAALLHVITDTLGSVAAIIAGISVYFWKLYIMDPILSMVVVLLLIPSTYNVMKNSLSILMEFAPKNIDIEDIEKRIRNVEGVVDVHDLHIWSITSGNDILTVHIVTDRISSSQDILRKVHEIAENYGINHTTIQIENTGFPCPEICPVFKKEGRNHIH